MMMNINLQNVTFNFSTYFASFSDKFRSLPMSLNKKVLNVLFFWILFKEPTIQTKRQRV